MAEQLVNLGFAPPARSGARPDHELVTGAAPSIPRLATPPPRWNGGHWVPFLRQPLVRHVSVDDDGEYTVTIGERPPPGYRVHWHLGCVSMLGYPHTVRVVAARGGGYKTVEHWRSLPAEADDLGFAGVVPFPLLVGLECRRLPDGADVLCAGPDDPLTPLTEPVEHLGFVEPYPIAPPLPPPACGSRALSVLSRVLDESSWRHRYVTNAAGDVCAGGLCLGSVRRRSGGSGYVALARGPDGRLVTDLLSLSTQRPRPATVLKWAAAPLRWNGAGRRRRLGAVYERLRWAAGRRLVAPDPRSDEVIGFLRGEPAPGWAPLFSTTHPVTGDQYLTRSELEATDMGYRVDGLLGYVHGRDADRHPGALEIRWASRFGRVRRYVEPDTMAVPAVEEPGEAADAARPPAERTEGTLLLEPLSASGLAAVGLVPGGRVDFAGAPTDVVAACALVSGSDAALLALAAEPLREHARRTGCRVVLSAEADLGAGRHPSWAPVALALELLEEHEAVCMLSASVMIVDPGIDLFGSVSPDHQAAGRPDALAVRAGGPGHQALRRLFLSAANLPADEALASLLTGSAALPGVASFSGVAPYAARRQAMLVALLDLRHSGVLRGI